LFERFRISRVDTANANIRRIIAMERNGVSEVPLLGLDVIVVTSVMTFVTGSVTTAVTGV